MTGGLRTSPGYRADIDGLRGLAVVSVVAYHAGVPWITGGFAGVDVFFVISGFVITALLERELAASGTISISHFYARRIRRLLPALAVVLVATLLLGVAIYPKLGELTALAKSAVASVFLSANHYFLATRDNYFDGTTELKPLAHIWSLSVEEQFYLVWPLLLLAVGRGHDPARRARRSILALVVLVAGSFALSVTLVRSRPEAAFFILPSRAWELGAGALLAFLPVPAARRMPVVGSTLAAIGLLAITIAMVVLTRVTPFPGWAALLPAAGTALVILGNAHAPGSAIARALGARIPVAIGLCAYGWYLWHWPLLAMARYWRLGAPNLVQDTGIALASLGLAIGSLRFVERPFYRRGQHTATLPGRTILVGASVMAMVAAAAVGVGAYGKWAPRSAKETLAASILADDHPAMQRCLTQGAEWAGLPPVAACVGGDDGQPPSVAIWGDSHANAWSPLLGAAMAGPRDAYLVLYLPLCPPAMDVTPRRRSGRAVRECVRFNRAAIATLQRAAARGLSGVVLVARWPMYGGAGDVSVLNRGETFADTSNRSPASALQSLRAGLDLTVTRLRQSGLRVLILLSPPEMPYMVASCLLARPVASCGVDRATYLTHAAATWDVIRSVAARHDSVRVVDPSDYFCDAIYCPPFVRGHPAIMDDDHVTASTAAAFGASIAADLAWLRGVVLIDRNSGSVPAIAPRP